MAAAILVYTWIGAYYFYAVFRMELRHLRDFTDIMNQIGIH